MARCFRLYSSAAKSQLALLRRKTGFPLGKCREALLSNNDDLEVAEKWLYSRAQAEGWAKLGQLKDRTASQGLIGMLIRDNKAAMVEVNCETDFVAKNEKFETLVTTVTRALLNHQPPNCQGADLSSVFFTHEDLQQLQDTSSRPLANLVAESVGFLAENIILKRGCLMASSQGVISGHVYNSRLSSDDLAMGKYGALLHLLPSNETFSDVQVIENLGQKLGQHIIGLNPLVINEGDEGITDPAKVLNRQEFVLDNKVIVGDMLAKNDAKITKFVRYSLGEY